MTALRRVVTCGLALTACGHHGGTPRTYSEARGQASSNEHDCQATGRMSPAARFEACYRAGLLPTMLTYPNGKGLAYTVFDLRDEDLKGVEGRDGKLHPTGEVHDYDRPEYVERLRPFIETACQLELMGATPRLQHAIDPCLVLIDRYPVRDDFAAQTLAGVCNRVLAEPPYSQETYYGNRAGVPESAAYTAQACIYAESDVNQPQSHEWGGYNRYTFSVPTRPEHACIHPRLLQSPAIAQQDLFKLLQAACDRGSSQACLELMKRVPPQYQDYSRQRGYASALETCGNCGPSSTCDLLDAFIPNDPRSQEARARAQRTNDAAMAQMDRDEEERLEHAKEVAAQYKADADQAHQNMLDGIQQSGVYLQQQLSQQTQTYAQAQQMVADNNRGNRPAPAPPPAYQPPQTAQQPSTAATAAANAAASRQAARESCLRSFTPTTVAHTNPFPAYVQQFQGVVSAIEQCPAQEKLASCLSRVQLWPELGRIRQELQGYFDACGYANVHKGPGLPCGAGQLGIPNTERDTCAFLGRQGCLPNMTGAVSEVANAANNFAAVYAAADAARNDQLRQEHEQRCWTQYPN